jgi:hypothetical protein
MGNYNRIESVNDREEDIFTKYLNNKYVEIYNDIDCKILLYTYNNFTLSSRVNCECCFFNSYDYFIGYKDNNCVGYCVNLLPDNKINHDKIKYLHFNEHNLGDKIKTCIIVYKKKEYRKIFNIKIYSITKLINKTFYVKLIDYKDIQTFPISDMELFVDNIDTYDDEDIYL